jgi:capsid portal protein
VLLNNSLKLVLGTLDKVVTKLGKVVGYGSGIPQTMGLDEDRTIAPPEVTKAKIEDKSFVGLLEGKLKGEIALADLAFKNLNKTLAEGVVVGIKNISLGIAESIVLGKKLSDTFREITQKILVKILSQLIEEQLIRISINSFRSIKTCNI